jgi:GT2 family glycosyltransferase
MRVSVVIATYNRRDLLLGCLAAVSRLEYPDFEVIVADDGSTDGSIDAARQLFPQVRYLPHPTNTGEPGARNRGVRAATGDLIAFTDDDCLPPRDWLQRHARYYDDPRIAAAGGPQICRSPNFYEAFDVAQWTIRFDRLETIERIRQYEHLLTGNLSVRRDVFAQIGPFDEQFRSGCDSDFIRRLSRAGYHFVRDPDLQVDHLKVHDFRGYIRFRFQRALGSLLIDVKEGTLRARRFVPVLNLVQTLDNWRRFAREHGGGAGAFVGFWGLAVLTRIVDVAGRAYYYTTVGRRYRVPAVETISKTGSLSQTGEGQGEGN